MRSARRSSPGDPAGNTNCKESPCRKAPYKEGIGFGLYSKQHGKHSCRQDEEAKTRPYFDDCGYDQEQRTCTCAHFESLGARSQQSLLSGM